MVDTFKFRTSHPILPAAAPLSQWTVEERRRAFTSSKEQSKTRRFSSKPYWQATYHVFLPSTFANGSETENMVLTLRRVCHEDPIDLEPEQLTLITPKQRNVPPSSRRLELLHFTKNRRTLIWRVAEQAEFARTGLKNTMSYNSRRTSSS